MSERNVAPIGVIADDLTGAAELAGIAHDRGLRVELLRRTPREVTGAVILIDTDTRSVSAHEARQRTEAAAAALRAVGCRQLFKKVDSLLRGHVAAEIAGVLAGTNQRRCLLASANWRAGRAVVGGRLTIEGRPLEETWAARDPEYPRTTSVVRILLGEPAGGDPAVEILTPDVSDQAAAEAALSLVDADTLPAGAADFFALWLDRHARTGMADAPPPLQGRRLLVVGSRAGWLGMRGVFGHEAALRPTEHETPGNAAVMPAGCLAVAPAVARRAAAAWGDEIAGCLKQFPDRIHMMAIGREEPVPLLTPLELVGRLAEAAAVPAAECTPADAVLIDGGGTAAALLSRLGHDRFAIGGRWAEGVVELRSLSHASGPRLIVKVGSYRWPDALLVAPGAAGAAAGHAHRASGSSLAVSPGVLP